MYFPQSYLEFLGESFVRHFSFIFLSFFNRPYQYKAALLIFHGFRLTYAVTVSISFTSEILSLRECTPDRVILWHCSPPVGTVDGIQRMYGLFRPANHLEPFESVLKLHDCSGVYINFVILEELSFYCAKISE